MGIYLQVLTGLFLSAGRRPLCSVPSLRRFNFFTNRIINIWNSLPENVISAKNTKIFEHRLDNYWKDQDLLYNYESNLTTGEEIEIDEEKELSIVVDGQRSETDL
jgi:hypothetical protein